MSGTEPSEDSLREEYRALTSAIYSWRSHMISFGTILLTTSVLVWTLTLANLDKLQWFVLFGLRLPGYLSLLAIFPVGVIIFFLSLTIKRENVFKERIYELECMLKIKGFHVLDNKFGISFWSPFGLLMILFGGAILVTVFLVTSLWLWFWLDVS